MKFRKLPVEIEAVQYLGNGNLGDTPPEWIWDAFVDDILQATNGTDPLIILTLEGELEVSPNDWIIKGIRGEIYPCKPDIFAATYEQIL